MDLYIDPIATTCRAVMALCKAGGLDVTIRQISLMKGEHQQAAFGAINPNRMVPVLVDGDFVLTEGIAILCYLARKAGSELYPTGLRERARVDELLSWFGTNFNPDFGLQYVYPQTLPQCRRATEEANRGTIEWGREQSKRWLRLLDSYYLGPERSYLVGDRVTIADYYGAAMVSIGELVACSFADYPNVERWYRSITSEASWRAINGEFLGFAESIRLRDQVYVDLADAT